MGHLSTHVLDTMHGCPAAGMKVSLQRLQDDGAVTIQQLTLNADGRNSDGALLNAETMRPGRYRLLFEVAPYFRSRGVMLPEPAFLDTVPLDFGIADAAALPFLSLGPTAPTSQGKPAYTIEYKVYTVRFTSPRSPLP